MTRSHPLHASMIAVVAVGGAVGACLRYALTTAFPDPSDGFPWTIFAINVAGCLLLALLPAFPAVRHRAHLPPLLGTGVLGGFTTLSTYAEQSRGTGGVRERGGRPVTVLYVALGAAVGAPLRYVAGHLIDGGLPRGTILVNLVGSFLLGVSSGLGMSGEPFALLGTGLCGALTTYSSFVVQTHDRGPRTGGLNVVLTIVPALLLCGLGFWVGAR